MTPTEIKSAYGMNSLSQNGSGQTLALMELDGYKASDIPTFESQYGLPQVPIQNIQITPYSGAVTDGAVEFVLDIEMMVALVPGATKILVYEAENTNSGLLAAYQQI